MPPEYWVGLLVVLAGLVLHARTHGMGRLVAYSLLIVAAVGLIVMAWVNIDQHEAVAIQDVIVVLVAFAVSVFLAFKADKWEGRFLSNSYSPTASDLN